MAKIPSGSLVPLRLLLELTVPKVEIEIELLFVCGIDDPEFATRIPTLPELRVSPGEVLMFTAPDVDFARIAFCEVPVIVTPALKPISSGPLPLVIAAIPTVAPETLPLSTIVVEPVPEFVLI